MPKKIDFLKAKVNAILDVLGGVPSQRAEQKVAPALLEQFNGILEEIAKEFPQHAKELPQPLKTKNALFAAHGMTDIKYLDLQMVASQVMNILGVIESHD